MKIKRIIAVMLACMIVFVQLAYAVPSIKTDFDNLEEGSTDVGIKVGDNTASSYIKVAADPKNSENKVLEINHDSSYDRYLSFSGDYNCKFVMQFRLLLTKGSFSMYFRDVHSTANNFTFFRAGSDLRCAGAEQKFDTGNWVTVKMVIDMESDYIALYSDVENNYNGIVKLVKESTLTEIGGEQYKKHEKTNTTLRMGPMKTSSRIYIDDLEMYSPINLYSDLSIRSFTVYKNILGEESPVSNLRTGNLSFVTYASSMGEEERSLTVVGAVYDKNERMKQMASTEKITVYPGEEKKISLDMSINELEDGDYAKLFIVDDTDNMMPLANAFGINQSELYYRPGANEVLESFYNNFKDGSEHPRVILTSDDFARLKTYYNNDSDYKSWFARIQSTTNSYLSCALPEYVYDARNTILDKSRYVMNRILSMAFMYKMTGDTKYADGVWRLAERVCDTEYFPDWNAQHHYLDTGEMGLAVAIAYDWCYDYWTDEEKQILETALYNNIVEISLGCYEGRYSYSGLRANTNWNPVCNGGSITAALAIFNKYPKECSKLISYSITSLERCLGDYAPSGGYSESPGYWEYGTTYLMWCMSALDAAFKTDFGIGKSQGLSETGYFPAYISGPTGNWNYHDGGTGYLNTGLSFYFASKYNDSNLAGMRYNLLKSGIYSSSVNPCLQDLMFYRPELINDEFYLNNLDLDYCYKGIETAVMRGSFTDKNTLFTGLHGGYNSANHGDLDAGCFIVDMNGKRMIDEMGGDNYTLPGYFGKGDNGSSWVYYRKNTEGQNTIMIADDSSIPYGQKPTANIQIEKFVSKPTGSYAVADMTPALGKKVISAKRGVFLTNYRSEIVVQDEIAFNENTELYWLAHTKGDITVAPDGKSALISYYGVKMAAYLISDDDSLVFETGAEEPFLSTTTNASGQASRNNFSKLYIHAKDVTSFNAAVVFKEYGSQYEYEKTSIENWDISDEKMPKKPYLSMIYVNGQPISDFMADKTDYRVILPSSYDSNDFEISCDETEEGYCADIDRGGIGEDSKITVYHKNFPKYSTTYIVNVSKEPKTIQNTGTKKLETVSVSASETPESNHPASKAIDNNLDDESRWSAETSGATLTLDLGEVKSVSGVSVAFYKALSRKYKFSVLYSSDGKVYSSILTDVFSSSLTDKEEMFMFEKSINARYIRFKGFGNNENAWNSVVEFAAF